ncbi:cytochrome P450 [Xylariomycetidae sp. FL2044]|nr:cytochrome P450 [Xylariomycetidae sp. FL2044]
MDLLTCLGLTMAEVVAFLPQAGDSTAASYSSRFMDRTFWSLYGLHYLALMIYRVFLYPRYFSPLRHLPGPKNNHIFFGQSIHLFRAESPTSLYVQWMSQNPRAPFIRYLSFANRKVLVANTIRSHQGVLKEHCYSFTKPRSLRRMLKEIAGGGIFMIEGEKHQLHRKALGAAFSPNRIRDLQTLFRRKSEELCHVLDGAIAANGNGTTGVVDCNDLFSKATLDIVATATLGVDLCSLSSTSPSLRRDPNSIEQFNFHQAYNAIAAQGFVGKLLMWANGFFPTRWIPLRANREFLSATIWLSDTLTELVRLRFRTISEKERDSDDLLSLIVDEAVRGQPAVQSSEEELVGHLLQFMIAGHDTSATMLAWSAYILATRPDIQAALRAEVKGLAYDSATSDFALIDKLPYLHNFVMEILRVYPPATTLHRHSVINMTIDGVFIPRGTVVDIVPAVAMRNPTIWDLDADEVDPTRWARRIGDQKSPYAFEAFSNGPRICIGRSFALMEIKIILFDIIRHYDIVGLANSFTISNPSFVLRPAGLKVCIQKLPRQDQEGHM